MAEAPIPPPLILPSATPSAAATSSSPPTIQPSNNPNNNPSTTSLLGQTLAPKRQRRPSVRLGDIGGEPTLENSNFRRPKSSWRFHKHPNSKTRPLTNLLNNQNKNASFFHTFAQTTSPNAQFSLNKPKSKKPIKRARTNWSKFEPTNVNVGIGLGVSEFENDVGFRDDENDLRGFEQEQSPVNSRESLGFRDRRVSESSGGHHEMEQNSGDGFRNSSVKDWLVGLGLGRYGPVFEIHEVDDEVLPMLTMEDLKDMGINAVGSRRKMYRSIEKLQKEFL